MVHALRLTDLTEVTVPLAGQLSDPWCPGSLGDKNAVGPVDSVDLPKTPHHCAHPAPGVATSLLHDHSFLTRPNKCSRELVPELGGGAV